MAWYDEDSLLTRAFKPDLLTILITILVVILAPILLHLVFFGAAAPKHLPRFVLLGPSGSGKTALVAQLERGEQSQTHTSISPITVEARLPSNVAAGSSRYRSENDVQPGKKILLADTPGHAKLRHQALSTLASSSKSQPLTGVIFVVDASAIGSDGSSSEELTETATYLHDVLLQLQKLNLKLNQSKMVSIPFLIAGNKMDLFTALPEKLVKSTLEKEITKLRETRSRGIASIAEEKSAEGLNFGSGNPVNDEEGEVLGGDASAKFEFEGLDEWGIDVTVKGGSVVEGEAGVEKWWQWIAGLL